MIYYLIEHECGQRVIDTEPNFFRLHAREINAAIWAHAINRAKLSVIELDHVELVNSFQAAFNLFFGKALFMRKKVRSYFTVQEG